MEVTLKRAWEALSVGERLDLGRSLVQLAFQRSGIKGGSSDDGGTGGNDGDSGLGAAEKVRRRKGQGTRALVCWLPSTAVYV